MWQTNMWEQIFDFGPQLIFMGYVIGASKGVKKLIIAQFFIAWPLVNQILRTFYFKQLFVGDNGLCAILESTWQAEQIRESGFLNWVSIPKVTLGNYPSMPWSRSNWHFSIKGYKRCPCWSFWPANYTNFIFIQNSNLWGFLASFKGWGCLPFFWVGCGCD